MPELPEVETVRRGLEPVLVGKRIERLECRRPNLRFPLPENFGARLAGRKIERLARRAKYLVADVEGGESLVMHLGMTGRFSVQGSDGGQVLADYVYAAGGDDRHDHVVFHLGAGRRLVYNDARRFGFMLMLETHALAAHPMFRHLGVEPLGADFTPEYLLTRAAGKKVNLKNFLMDQRVIAGLGNIYVSEALFRASLSPDRAARTLNSERGGGGERANALVEAVRTVIAEAIEAGGSTLRDYRRADGSIGAFQERFLAYDRGGKPCLRTGCAGTMRRAVHAGRATFYCPRCQR